jgi:hypothetical protein
MWWHAADSYGSWVIQEGLWWYLIVHVLYNRPLLPPSVINVKNSNYIKYNRDIIEESRWHKRIKYNRSRAATQSCVTRGSSLGARYHSFYSFHLLHLLVVLRDFHRTLYSYGVLWVFRPRQGRYEIWGRWRKQLCSEISGTPYVGGSITSLRLSRQASTYNAYLETGSPLLE